MSDRSVLTGQVAVVTGGGRGLGLRVSKRLAADGATVVLAGRDIATLTAARDALPCPDRHHLLTVDVRDGDSVAAFASCVLGEVGVPTLLVNNAGTMASGPLWCVPPDDWWRDIEVSLRGTYNCCRYFLPSMLERGSGRIVNLSSAIAVRASLLRTSYASAKAGITRLSECLSAEVADLGVQVFAVNPGLIRTDLTEALLQDAWVGEDLASRSADEWTDPAIPAEFVARIAAGDLDELTGRHLDATDDIDSLRERAEEIVDRDLLTLRLLA